ncbi:hypothetical protein [Lysinibacillus sp. NPDC096212]|uniref:hypothetical protein n=1 Tax=Lysinibacillus sp. NPDC096212 TaxID=3364135 RepID=UPI0038033703
MTKSKAKVDDIYILEIGTSEFAKLVGKTPQWIRQLTRDGVLTQCGRGRYNLGENILAYIEHISGGKEENGKPRYVDAKTEHEILKKEKTEMQLQQLRGQLHAAEDVRLVMGDMILSAKSKLLTLPARIAGQLEGESTKTIEQTLRTEIEDTLTVLVEYSPQMFVKESSE